MINLLIKLFIKDKDNLKNPDVRRKYGILCGGTGIAFNVFLFLGKILVGLFSKSVAVMADAFNNLSDAGSSIITMIGFKLAGKKPDAEHPFGHGRIEYISGLIVSMLIILMGFELATSSIKSIIHPEEVTYNISAIIILVVSILVKLYMVFYNKKIGKKISSSAMEATAIDSLSDVIATSVVLLSVIIAKFTSIHIDGYAGLVVALFILYSGFCAGKETIEPLLGTPPEPGLVEEIEETVKKHPEIIGVHDLVVHDYGPGRLMISLHAEVSSHNDFFAIHDVIDNIEVEVSKKFTCETVIHMDPIDTDNHMLENIKQFVKQIVLDINQNLTIHDFRMVPGKTHTNLIFDVVLDDSLKMTEEELRQTIIENVRKEHSDYNCVIKFDLKYV